MTSRTPAQQRALDIALVDFTRRVSWADTYDVSVEADGPDASSVAFLRIFEPGELQRRGGGIDAGITYRITADGAIDRITYPR